MTMIIDGIEFRPITKYRIPVPHYFVSKCGSYGCSLFEKECKVGQSAHVYYLRKRAYSA